MIQKLALHHDKMLKGEFNLKELNFLFVFQVNCPGCFIYGIPTVNNLYEEFGERMSFLGLSTAFEDFSLNTEDHIKSFLDTGEMVGETKNHFTKQGYTGSHLGIDFPVAMDSIADDSFDLKSAALKICQENPNYRYWPKFEQDHQQENVIRYLKSQEKVSLSFTLNQLRGTPTFLVFNGDMEIRIHHFGYQTTGQIKTELEELLSQSN